MFAYPDAQRYRLGANYTQLPSNRAICPVYAPHERDGAGTITRNYGGDPSYLRSSLTPAVYSHRAQELRHNERLQSGATLGLNEIPVDEEDFVQPRELWRTVFDDAERHRWVANVAGTLDAVSPTLRTDVIGMFAKVDPRIGQMLTSQLSEGSRL